MNYIDLANASGGKSGRWPKTRRRQRGNPLSPSVRRDPRSIHTIVLHQTATEMPPSKKLVEKYGDQTAEAIRAARSAYHHLALTSGNVVRAKPCEVYAHHAGVLNRFSCGVAVVARLPGLQDDPTTKPREDLRTLWRWRESPATEVTGALIYAGREALRFQCHEVSRMGGRIEYILAHRQGSKNRRSDPGELLWHRLVNEYAQPKLGLVVRPSEWWGSGRPIPSEWDRVAGKGSY